MRSFLLGAKTEVKSWTNPYVTDGLVAMWDGEWNAGGGVHDANATVWKDLTGSYDCIIREGVLFADKYATCSSVVKSWAYGQKSIEDQINTIEIVIYRASNGVAFCSGQNTASADVRITNQDINGNLFCYTANIATSSGTAVRNALKASTEPHHIAFISGSSRQFVNGVGYVSAAAGSSGIMCSNIVSIGGREYNDSNRLVGDRIYCIRIYSRTLTDEEIAANYAIDARRFGL